MKDMAMEVILALGSGIVLAMFGIGVPDPNEAKKVIEVFSKDVSDVLNKTFGVIQGDTHQVGEFTAAQTSLLRTIRGVADLSEEEKDTVALIIERTTRDAVAHHQMDLDTALQAGASHSAAPLFQEMTSLNTSMQTITERAGRIARLLEFEHAVFHKRGLTRSNASFEDVDNITAESVREDAKQQFEEAEQLMGRFVGGKHIIPMSPLMKDSKTGQQTVILGTEEDLLSALNVQKASLAPEPPNNMMNVWFAMSVDVAGYEAKTPMMALRKREDWSNHKSKWLNHDGAEKVTLISPEKLEGQVDATFPQNVRIWQWHIDQFAMHERELSFFLDLTNLEHPGLTQDDWSPWYAYVMEDKGQKNIFFQTFLTSLLRHRED